MVPLIPARGEDDDGRAHDSRVEAWGKSRAWRWLRKRRQRKVVSLCKDDGAEELVLDLERMNQEAAETERRCTELAGSFDGKKTAILEEAQATKNKGSEMMSIYLDDDSHLMGSSS